MSNDLQQRLYKALNGSLVLRPTLVHGKHRAFYAMRRVRAYQDAGHGAPVRQAQPPGASAAAYHPPTVTGGAAPPLQGSAQAQHDFGCVMTDVPTATAAAMEHWSRVNIEPDTVDAAAGGYESRLHVTVKFGLSPGTGDEVAAMLKAIADEVHAGAVRLGKVNVFHSDDADVVHIEVRSPTLVHLNHLISSALPCQGSKHPYKPHVTLAYVRPGSAAHLAGDDTFAGQRFPLSNIVYRDANGHGTEFSLGLP